METIYGESEKLGKSIGADVDNCLTIAKSIDAIYTYVFDYNLFYQCWDIDRVYDQYLKIRKYLDQNHREIGKNKRYAEEYTNSTSDSNVCQINEVKNIHLWILIFFIHSHSVDFSFHLTHRSNGDPLDDC